MLVPLAAYGSEQIRVRLSDTDSDPIVEAGIPGLLPKGASGKNFQYKLKTKSGVQKVQLQNKAPKVPGTFKVKVKASGWFTQADANQAAGDTELRVDIGASCFTHAVTKKPD
jgi:hypothetical protein